MYYLETGGRNDTRFKNAFLLAIAAHLAIIMGVSFNAHQNTTYNTPQIEVTLATRPSEQAQAQARNLAQADQAGSGNESEQERLTTSNPLQSDTPSDRQNQTHMSQPQSALQYETLTTTAMARRQATTDSSELPRPESSLEGISPEVDQISREIASLKAELDNETRTDVNQPRVRRLTAASAKQSVDAAYLLDWRKRLEAVGNQYYPQASIRYGMYGELSMLVVIANDGSLEDIQILSSSGYAVLDEAAIKIVRMAAPYAPFPDELKATTDKLEIVRTWHFQENQLSSP
jgi:protein TonB